MIGILATLCVLQAQGRVLDGEAAVARSHRLLKDLGIHENFTLQSLSDRFYLAKEPCWDVWFRSKQGRIAVVLDARTGRALFVQVVQAKEDPAIQRAVSDPPTPVNTRRAWKMLHQLGYNDTVTLTPRSGYANGPAGGIFYRTLHGLIFFNWNPTYGHRLVIEPDTGAINYFLPSPPLPEVNAWKPAVSGHAALEKMSLWVKKRAEEKHRALVSVPRTEQTVELGYWKFHGEATARLVWQPVSYTKMRGAPYGLGGYRILVDALTGDLIEPDDSLIGMNP
jgi:hypothetical protein